MRIVEKNNQALVNSLFSLLGGNDLTDGDINRSVWLGARQAEHHANDAYLSCLAAAAYWRSNDPDASWHDPHMREETAKRFDRDAKQALRMLGKAIALQIELGKFLGYDPETDGSYARGYVSRAMPTNY